MEELNAESLAHIWESDETVGTDRPYFMRKELRDKARKESQAPRNSYELAFLNQFFTRDTWSSPDRQHPRSDRYEMHQGKTALTDRCEYCPLP